MSLLGGTLTRMVRCTLRSLPIPDYHKTRIWATSIPRPIGRVHDWAYYRCIDLAVRAFATEQGYGTAFPGAGNPSSSYSMLEFGVANGQSLRAMLHFRDVVLRRFRLRNKVTVLGFDTFERIPAPRAGDQGLPWKEGDFSDSNMSELNEDLGARFKDFRLVKGIFSNTLPFTRAFLAENPPVFVSIDCDYYSSTIDVFDVLLPDLAPHGCMFYLDDASINFGSDKTGELKAVAEVNAGRYGDHLQLVEYPLWIETGEMRHFKQIWRLFNLNTAEAERTARADGFRRRSRDNRISPL